MAKAVDDHDENNGRKLGNAERDIVALGIAFAAIILFVGTGGTVMPQIVRAWMGTGETPDMVLTNAVLLNIALLIFGWRRYADLQREVAERRSAEQRARELAEIDPLTGCLNRRSGTPAIERLRADAKARHREVAVFMIDLDNFKHINDLNGHQMGDKVLAQTARRIRALMPSEGVLARIGGDEFACAMSYERHDRDRIEQFAAQVIASVSAIAPDDSLVVEPTVSVGLSTTADVSSADGEADSDTLIHRADIAMYQAKKNGRNRFFWFAPHMENELRFRNELEAAIRHGIANREFVPFYEQQVDLETGKLSGFEMLARWKSPRYGVIGPEVFIAVAEEMDVIAALSEDLIRQALRDARDWHPSLTLSVNISPLQLRDPWFAQKLLRLLVESGFPPSRLEIEITESCLHENIGAVRSIVSSLKNQGIRISLDDFGTGYSSLAHLRQLPFDRLKIDRSFVSEMTREGGGADLVAAIISLGKGLSLPITAEGIESPKILQTLKAMGQLKGQGYLYGHPEDAVTTRQRLADMAMLADPLPDPGSSAFINTGAEQAERRAG